MILVHGSTEANPYFIVIDEVEANPGDQIKNYLHPANQSSVSAQSSNMEYEVVIDHYSTVVGTKLSFFYGTPPLEVNIEKVPSAVPDRYPGYPDHNRLESVYDVDVDGDLNLITILFPHDGTHAKPPITSIVGTGFSGSGIDHGSGINDIILESAGDQEIGYGNIIFYGKSVLSRDSNAANIFYFIRQGTKFDQDGVGFEADLAISIYAKKKNGVVISEGAKLKLHGQGMNTVNFVPSVTVVSSGADFIEVQLPSGEVRFNGS